ncbi:unnamed protein product [Heterobilharzia americana]|nr:unnamed protein product [Heterobilharzia americana]
MEAVLRRIGEFGLLMTKTKSKVSTKSVTLLGHKVGKGEMKPLPEKILTVKTMSVPNSKRKLRQFLGRAEFFSRFLRKSNEIAAPLCKLLGNPNFMWTEEAWKTFVHITELLNHQEKTLKLPITGEPFIVPTDASDYGIGAVLRQTEGVVDYAKRVLTSAEQKYSTVEKECLAIFWGLDKWRCTSLVNDSILKLSTNPYSGLRQGETSEENYHVGCYDCKSTISQSVTWKGKKTGWQTSYQDQTKKMNYLRPHTVYVQWNGTH